MNAGDLEAAARSIAGTARSMGVDVSGQPGMPSLRPTPTA
jgi:hypothetical protein